MNEFLYLFRGGNTSKLSPQEMEGVMNKWQTWIGQIAQEGKLKDGGSRLHSKGSVVSGKGIVTDGPYSDGKEIIGGYIIVKSEDLAAASELSKGCPIFEVGGIVEVRPVIAM